MNPIKLVIGFVPFVLFTVVDNLIPTGWAALVGLVAALAVIAVTARGGLKVLPVVQAVILLVIAVLGFVGGPAVDAFLTQYGRGVASLLLGLFIVATAATMPFTAQFARAAVPPAAWHSPEFLQVNRHLSLAWGYVVLIVGVCHIVERCSTPTAQARSCGRSSTGSCRSSRSSGSSPTPAASSPGTQLHPPDHGFLQRGTS
jgi:hypothetical protein